MARKKTAKVEPTELTKQASKSAAIALAEAFDKFTVEKYGALNPPPPYMTPTGISTLDALLGGGLASSMPIAFSSTAETGKSSIAFQFVRQFLDTYENSLAVYFDVESNAAELEIGTATIYQESRAETFKLSDDPRFRYNRKPYTIKEFFEYLDNLVQLKRKLQAEQGGEIRILFVLDSITALSYSRIEAVEDFDKIPG